MIAPDIVGYGESDKPKAPYSRHYFSNWLKEFLLSLNISKAHIVGLSQGGAIALQFVLDNPVMVDKLVLVDAGALGAKPSFSAFLGMLWLNAFPSSLASKFYSRYILFNTNHRDPLHEKYSISVIKSKGGRNAFLEGRCEAVSPISANSLSSIQNETLIIWGENDKLFSIIHGENAARIIPNSIFLPIKSSGHLPLIDQPEIFNNSVIKFLTTS